MLGKTALLGAAAATACPVLAAADSPATGMLTGQIRPVNPHLTSGAPVGEITMTTQGDAVAIVIDGEGFAPGRHMAHIHGFAGGDPAEATCPPPDADANADGVIDLIETRASSGVTLIPLNGDPATLKLGGADYPRADETGALDYRATVSDAALSDALRAARDAPPALARRVVMVHGVMKGVGLPDSVRSLEGAPAHATLPIACAELAAEE